jgi:hypothetical protein
MPFNTAKSSADEMAYMRYECTDRLHTLAMHLLSLYPTSNKQQLCAIYRRLIDALLFAMRLALGGNTVQITIEKERNSWRNV